MGSGLLCKHPHCFIVQPLSKRDVPTLPILLLQCSTGRPASTPHPHISFIDSVAEGHSDHNLQEAAITFVGCTYVVLRCIGSVPAPPAAASVVSQLVSLAGVTATMHPL
jgi:hypothetical protein